MSRLGLRQQVLHEAKQSLLKLYGIVPFNAEEKETITKALRIVEQKLINLQKEEGL